MKTIKVIDLLNKIANGEKVPKKIKVTGTIYEYDEEFKFYFTTTKNGQVALGGKRDDINLIFHYNYELIIIEEEKKLPKKLEEIGKIDYNLEYIDYKNIEELKKWLNNDIQSILNELDLIVKNQNQLIDYLESKGE